MAAGGIDAPWSLCVLELQWSRSVIAAEKFLGLVAGAMGYELQWSRNVKAAERTDEKGELPIDYALQWGRSVKAAER